MALQTRLKKIAPIALTADGGARGEVTTASSCAFVLSQIVVLTATGIDPITLRVRRVPSEFTVELGPIDGDTKDRTDITAYTAILAAAIEANEQDRPIVPEQEIERHTFQDEPTVARRSFMVDCKGEGYRKDNPFPVQLSDGSIDIGTVNAELEVQLSHQDNVPDAGDVADSTQVGDGVEILEINPDGSINVKVTGITVTTLDLKSVYGSISSLASSTLTSVHTYTVPIGKTAKFQKASFSGTNIATYTLLIKTILEDTYRTHHGAGLNGEFMVTDGQSGIPLTAGDTIEVKVIHARPMAGDFNARIQVIEI